MRSVAAPADTRTPATGRVPAFASAVLEAHRCNLCVNAPVEPVRPAGRRITWQTRCRCGHTNVRHTNTERWNNAGACRQCPCAEFVIAEASR